MGGENRTETKKYWSRDQKLKLSRTQTFVVVPPPAPSFPVTLPLYLSTTADDDAVKELETTLVKISSPDRGSKPA